MLYFQGCLKQISLNNEIKIILIDAKIICQKWEEHNVFLTTWQAQAPAPALG